MRLLSISFNHLKMFKDGKFSIDFFASDRVPSDDQTVYCITPPLYTNKVLALAGINASGKTSALELLRLAINILNGFPLTMPIARQVAGYFYDDPTFTAVFWDEGIWVLTSKLHRADAVFGDEPDSISFMFQREELYWYGGSSITKKTLGNTKDLLSQCSLALVRETSNTFADGQFISPTISIIATRFAESMTCFFAGSTSLDSLFGMPKGSDHILHVLDSNIEYLHKRSDDSGFDLKFKTEKRPMLIGADELRRVLSSGTLRGLNIVGRLLPVLGSGGYLLVDEIENHLNKQLVNVIVDLFSSGETNPKGATLVFTTHYPEVLDQVHRKDDVYFLVRDESHTTKILKYSDEVKRIENKKSEVFISNHIKGTAPKYADIKALRNLVRDVVNEVNDESAPY